MASFKTAYLQREVYRDVAVVGPLYPTVNHLNAAGVYQTAEIKVGDFVTVVEAAGVNPAYIQKSTVANATHIVAQSDQTLAYGHVPVENRDYRYNDSVAGTVVAVDNLSAATPVKHVALYKIVNVDDIIPDPDGHDHA